MDDDLIVQIWIAEQHLNHHVRIHPAARGPWVDAQVPLRDLVPNRPERAAPTTGQQMGHIAIMGGRTAGAPFLIDDIEILDTAF